MKHFILLRLNQINRGCLSYEVMATVKLLVAAVTKAKTINYFLFVSSPGDTLGAVDRKAAIFAISSSVSFFAIPRMMPILSTVGSFALLSLRQLFN
jgi:hypothetical protein